MATMTLAKTLKYRKRLVEEVGTLSSQISSNNSVVQGNARDVDMAQAMRRREALVAHLVAVKSAMTEANRPIQSSIYRAAELKGTIAFLKSLDTKHGTFPGSYGAPNLVYDAHYKASEVNARVKELEAEIDALQEKIDAFNYATTVELPESPQ